MGPLDVGKEVGTTVIAWVDERTSLTGAGPLGPVPKVPKGTNWFYTPSSLTMFAVVDQAITGVFLATCHRPSAHEAYGPRGT